MNAATTVLVIEDEPGFLRTLCAYLEDCGYRVLSAGNGLDGLEQLAREKPHVVLTDLRMPAMDGFEFLAQARLQSDQTPIIVITGTGDVRVQQAALEQGARACLLKPINDLQKLKLAIEQALAGQP